MAEKSCYSTIITTKVLANGSCLDSSSMESEPPDIRQWFPSYVYQSPEADSIIDYVKVSPISSRAVDAEESGPFVEDSETEQEEEEKSTKISSFGNHILRNYADRNGSTLRIVSDQVQRHSVSEIAKYSESPLSEPADIRNWFLSYEYESPALDSAEIGASIDGITEPGIGEGGLSGVSPLTDDFTMAKLQPLNGFARWENSSSDVGNHICASGKEKKRLLQVGELPVPAENEYRDRLKNVQNVRSEVECSRQMLRSQKDPRMKSECPNAFTREKCIGREAPVIYIKKEDERTNPVGSGWIIPNHKRRHHYSLKEETPNMLQEQEGNDFTSRKFKRSRTNDENVLKSEHNKSAVEDSKVIQRKALAETTNIERTNMHEVSGKWRCPQKTKAYKKGPPLKQLGLEQWIHRV